MSVELVTPSAVARRGRAQGGLSSADATGPKVTLAVYVTLTESVASVVTGGGFGDGILTVNVYGRRKRTAARPS